MPPRRSPFPCDIKIGGVGLMLGHPEKSAPLVATRLPDLSQSAPSDYSYSAQNPLEGTIFPYNSLLLGYGLMRQESANDRRYAWADGADCSTGDPMKGPEITTVTPSTVDAVNGVTDFPEINGVLYALNGRYCHKRNSDADWNTGRHDFGLGKAALDCAVFYPNNLSQQYAYFAMGESEPIHRFDGTATWAVHAEATKIYARAFAVIGSEFYRGHATNLLSRVDVNTDPFVEGNWNASNAWRVGDKSSAINRLAATIGGSLVALKTDNVYTVDTQNDDHPLFPHLQMAPDAANGRAVCSWMNDLYVNYRDGLLRILPDWSGESCGPDTLLGNTSPVKGRITALAGHDQFNLYAAVANADTGDSYLLKYGAWTEDNQGSSQRLAAWHGSIAPAFESKTITCLKKSTIGAPTGHTRLYLGFSDGSIGWFTLPCSANPAACSSYRFATADARVYLPTWTGGFEADTKNLNRAMVRGTLTPTAYAALEYRLVTNASYVDLGSSFNSVQQKDAVFPDGTNGTAVDFALVLKSVANTETPIVEGVGISHVVRRPAKMTYEFNVLADRGLVRRDGTPMRIGAAAIKQLIADAIDSGDTTVVVLPTEEAKKLLFKDQRLSVAWDERLRQWRAAIAVTAIEFETISIYGTWGRVRPYTWGDLKTIFTWDQIQTL